MSKRIEEFLKNASPETRQAFQETSQKLNDNKVELKSDSYGPQTPARRAEQTRTTEPQLNETVFPNQQTGAQRIQEAREQAQQPKAAESVQAPTQAQEPER